MDFPSQVSSLPKAGGTTILYPGRFDMRDHLNPHRLTLVMWDQCYLLRHHPGGSFENHDRVLDEAIERGYNTLRLDPLLQWLDLTQPEKILEWVDPQMPYMPWNWELRGQRSGGSMAD